MKKLFQLLLGLSLIFLVTTQCNKENSVRKNEITYQNQLYNIDKGVLENYGNIRGTGKNLDLTLLSNTLTIHELNGLIDSISGTGNGIYFEMYSSSTTALPVGDYTFDKDSTGNAGTFDYGNAILNFNTATNQGTNLDVTGGTVSVKSSGTIYEITFNCTVNGGQTLTGYYKGALKYYDNTQITSLKSGILKKSSWWKRNIK